MKKYSKINSFSQKPSIPQIVSYVLAIVQIIFFFVFVQNHIIRQSLRISLIIVYSICVLVQIIIAILISISDPSDQVMIKCLNHQFISSAENLRGKLYCQICKTFVQHSSKHCKICQRCVQKFDHHCIWINNCIGTKNYRMFIVLIIVTLLSMIIYITSICILWVQGQFYQYIISMGILWSSMIIVSVFIFLVFNLILFHLYLLYLGLTTYQFIMSNRTKNSVSKSIKKTTSNKIENNSQANKNNLNIEVTQQNIRTQQRENKIQENIKGVFEQSQNKNNSQFAVNNQSIRKEQASEQPNNGNFQISIELDKKSERKEIKKNSILNRISQKKNIFEQDNQISEGNVSRINEYFSQNRGLKILMSSDAINPRTPNDQYTRSNTNRIMKTMQLPTLFTPKSKS